MTGPPSKGCACLFREEAARLPQVQEPHHRRRERHRARGQTTNHRSHAALPSEIFPAPSKPSGPYRACQQAGSRQDDGRVGLFPITRRIDHPDGSFAGVAMAAVSVNYFQEFYERFDIGAGGAILLASMDGTLLVRRPFSEAAMGRDLSQGGIFRELLPRARTAAEKSAHRPTASSASTAIGASTPTLCCWRSRRTRTKSSHHGEKEPGSTLCAQSQ